jgi:hypothetical protein
MIRGDISEKHKPELIGEYRMAYKILMIDNSSPIVYPPILYKLGENISNRSSKVLTTEEEFTKKIHKGFHLLLDKKDALRFRALGEKMIEASYKDEDVVSYGYTSLDKIDKAYSVVVTKLHIRSLNDIWYPYLARRQ